MSEIKIESIVGVKQGPQVKLTWGEITGLLSTAQARKHAHDVLEAADAAESDDVAFLLLFVRNQLQQEPLAARTLSDFRRWRRAHSTDSNWLNDEDLT